MTIKEDPDYEYACVRVATDTGNIIGTPYWEGRKEAEEDFKMMSKGSKSTVFVYKLVKRRKAGEIEF